MQKRALEGQEFRLAIDNLSKGGKNVCNSTVGVEPKTLS